MLHTYFWQDSFSSFLFLLYVLMRIDRSEEEQGCVNQIRKRNVWQFLQQKWDSQTPKIGMSKSCNFR